MRERHIHHLHNYLINECCANVVEGMFSDNFIKKKIEIYLEKINLVTIKGVVIHCFNPFRES